MTASGRHLIDDGLRTLTARDVAEHANVALATFYRHFASVDDLLVTIFLETASPVVRRAVLRNLTDTSDQALIRALSLATAGAGRDEDLLLVVTRAVINDPELASRIIHGLHRLTDDDEPRPVVARRVRVATWRPSTDGDMTDRDIDEVRLFAEHLRRWVDTLPDEDPRLTRAETLSLNLITELRTDVPDRIILRRCIQIAVALLAEESAAVATGLDDAARRALGWKAQLDTALDGVAVEIEDAGTDQPETVGWGDGLDAIDGEVDALLDAAPDEAIAEIQIDDDAPARGSAMVRLLTWLRTTAAAGPVAGLAALDLAPVAWRAVEHLWNVIGL